MHLTVTEPGRTSEPHPAASSIDSTDAPSHKDRVVKNPGGHGPLSFAIIAMLLGVAAGFGAFAFRALIALFHNLFFLESLSFHYDTNQHTPVARGGTRSRSCRPSARSQSCFWSRTSRPKPKDTVSPR